MYLTHDLRDVLDALNASDRKFAESLLRSFNRYGLSEKQARCVNDLVKRAKGEVPCKGLPHA